MPDIFVETGHGLTDLVIDATELKFQNVSNFELNSLMFSQHYKNTQTGKALIGISPHGGGVLFSDIYPGSISDSEITEKSGAILLIEEQHEIMSDRGFSIQELCALHGIAWQMLAHVVNLTIPPIGPKDEMYITLFLVSTSQFNLCVCVQEIPNFRTKTLFLANHFISENI